MQKILLTLCCLALLAAPQAGLGKMVDRNVAIVNGETITLSEVNEVARPYFDKVRAEVKPADLAIAMSKARRIVVERLIAKRLVAQEAAKRNIKVSDEELDSTIKELMTRRNFTQDDLRKELSGMGITEKQYREEIRDQILNSKMINLAVRSRILVTDADVLARYQSQAEPDAASGKTVLLQLGTVWGKPGRDGAVLSKEQARKKIEKLRGEVLEGKDFATLARAQSDLPNAEDGGALGDMAPEDMAEAVRPAVEALAGQDVSPVVELEDSFVLFKRLEAGDAEGKPQNLAQPSAAERERIRKELMQERMDKAMDEWLMELRKKAYIKLF